MSTAFDTPPGGTVLDALSLLTATADDLLLAATRDTHRAVADRVHGLVRHGVGPVARPAALVHQGIAAGVYGVIGAALRGSTGVLDRIAATGCGPHLEDDPRGRFLTAAVNGLIGDQLLRERPQLAIPLAVRHEGRDVDPGPEGLTAAFPAATGRLAIFLHGLCEDESAWRLHRDRIGTTYGEALAARGWTPLPLRANTGLPVRENGAALASLLQQVVDAWPVPVERMALVGHSMGGLVLRAATAVVAGGGGPSPWAQQVTDVVTLGTPHRGATLAVGAGRGSELLARAPETAALGRVLDRRSAGIRDLVHGLGDEVAPLPHARYRLVSASVTGSARHPIGRLAGDLLVQPASATGRDTRGRELFPGATTLHVDGTDHFGLLNHPEVHAALRRWLA